VLVVNIPGSGPADYCSFSLLGSGMMHEAVMMTLSCNGKEVNGL